MYLGPTENTVVTLSIVLSSRDKAIVISVQEHPFEQVILFMKIIMFKALNTCSLFNTYKTLPIN